MVICLPPVLRVYGYLVIAQENGYWIVR